MSIQVLDKIHKLNQRGIAKKEDVLLMDHNHLEGENTQSEAINPHSNTDSSKVHHFDRLMFGTRRTPHHSDESKAEAKMTEDDNFLNHMNIEEIMTHIDSLVGSAKQLKPMFNNIRPLINQFFKK